MHTSKAELLRTAAGPRYPVNRFGVPGILRGPTISLAPEDDSGGGVVEVVMKALETRPRRLMQWLTRPSRRPTSD